MKPIGLVQGILLALAVTCQGASLLVEAESFENHGGWKLDTQFIQIMGSCYLLAHGLGIPVEDATTTITLPIAGQYRLWVRTKDWVARWQAAGHPGRFQIIIDDKPLEEIFGTKGAEWFWHDGGIVDLKEREVKLALHDLTGFDGRCDAIFFSTDLDKNPPSDEDILPKWRRDLLGLPDDPETQGPYDLVVVGGGYAGTCSAISAARMGCKVALIQDRPVLGGNGSQEIRVSANLRPWLMKIGKYPHLGEIVEELIDHTRHTEAAGTFQEADARRLQIVKSEQNIDLFLNHYAYDVKKEGAFIAAVIALNTRTNARRRFTGRLFADCTGHGTVGALAGADYDMTVKGHSGTTNMWTWRLSDTPQHFPDTPWALNLEMSDFPYPSQEGGKWRWQTGFDKNPIDDLEYIRDWNLRAIFGAWNAMKNKSGAAEHRNACLKWVAFIAGPRESRRLFGDIILTEQHIVEKQEFPDGLVPAAWFIDLHGPDQRYTKKYPDDPFIGEGLREREYVDPPYHVPYRCLYSRNITNLFMAGRDVSVTYEAHGLIRVMQTGGMMGEIVGKAASICVHYDCTPREVYQKHLKELKELAKLPGHTRKNKLVKGNRAKFELESTNEHFNLLIMMDQDQRKITIPRSWLVASEDDEEGYVSSFHYDKEIDSFNIGNGYIGLHISSYEIQKEGSAQAAAGRDVFLIYNTKNHTLHPGITNLGITKERVRSMGYFATNSIFLMADMDDDGLKDIGVIREELQCAQFMDRKDRISDPGYTRHPVRWYIFSEEIWKYNRVYDGQLSDKYCRELPLVGLSKSPVDYIKELCFRKNILILDYTDFGPQSIAYEFLGFQWYQWEKHGNDNPRARYIIKVVVYNNISLAHVQSLYPVSEEKMQDYRYVDYRDALTYLDRKIAELGENRKSESDRKIDTFLNDLQAELRNTKSKIRETFLAD